MNESVMKLGRSFEQIVALAVLCSWMNHFVRIHIIGRDESRTYRPESQEFGLYQVFEALLLENVLMGIFDQNSRA